MGLQTFPKTDIDDAGVTFCCRVFNSREVTTGKARSPMVERRVRGTTSDYVDAERIRWRASSADDWWSFSARYGGAVWCRHRYTRTANINLMRSGTFSQCNYVYCKLMLLASLAICCKRTIIVSSSVTQNQDYRQDVDNNSPVRTLRRAPSKKNYYEMRVSANSVRLLINSRTRH